MTWQAVPTGRPAWVALFYAARWTRSQRKFPPAGSGGPVPPNHSGFAPHRWDASSPPRSHVALTAARDSVRRLRRVLGGCVAQPVLRTSEHRSAVGRAWGQIWASRPMPTAVGDSRRIRGRVSAEMWGEFRRRCGRVSEQLSAGPGADVGESVPAQMWASQSRRSRSASLAGCASTRRST